MGAIRSAVVGSTAYAFWMPLANFAERFSTEPPPSDEQPVNIKVVVKIKTDLALIWGVGKYRW